jgi:hypothetical protein
LPWLSKTTIFVAIVCYWPLASIPGLIERAAIEG